MQDSTSWIRREASKHSDEVIRLGKRLVEELGLVKSVDTLSKGMAHYLAELIQDAERTRNPVKRKKASAKCCELIVRLWERRAALPKGAKPLGSLEPLLIQMGSLLSDNDPYLAVAHEHRAVNPWCRFVLDSHSIEKRMTRIAMLTAIAEANFGREKRWLVENKKSPSKQEAGIIQLFDNELNSPREWFTRNETKSFA